MYNFILPIWIIAIALSIGVCFQIITLYRQEQREERDCQIHVQVLQPLQAYLDHLEVTGLPYSKDGLREYLERQGIDYERWYILAQAITPSRRNVRHATDGLSSVDL